MGRGSCFLFISLMGKLGQWERLKMYFLVVLWWPLTSPIFTTASFPTCFLFTFVIFSLLVKFDFERCMAWYCWVVSQKWGGWPCAIYIFIAFAAVWNGMHGLEVRWVTMDFFNLHYLVWKYCDIFFLSLCYCILAWIFHNGQVTEIYFIKVICLLTATYSLWAVCECILGDLS